MGHDYRRDLAVFSHGMILSLPSKELSIAQTHYSEAVSDNWRWRLARLSLSVRVLLGADFNFPLPLPIRPRLCSATCRDAEAAGILQGSSHACAFPMTASIIQKTGDRNMQNPARSSFPSLRAATARCFTRCF